MEKEQKQAGKPVEVKLAAKQKHDNIFAALSALQGELKPMEKTAEVDFEKKDGKGRVTFKYTPLGEVMKTLSPLLAKNGLALRWELSKDGIEAVLTHETYKRANALLTTTRTPDGIEKVEQVSAGYVENELRSGIVKVSQGGDMKDVGGAITYAKRYSAGIVVGFTSEDDKDAELMEESQKNAVQTVFDRFKLGIENAKTSADVERQLKTIQKDVKSLADGKAPALGMTKEHYATLEKMAKDKISALDSAQA